MAYKITNDAETTLAVGMDTTATTLQVATGKGDLFPVVTGSDHTRITLENAGGDIECMKVTARANGSDSMTVVRAQDGTTAKSWLIGDIVSLRVTAGVVEDLQAEIDADVAAHEAAANPHPTYLTQAEGDGLYQALAATATKAGVQAQSYTAFTAAGTDTYTATPSPALTAYAAEQRFQITFTNANTGAATLNLNGLGAKAIKKQTPSGAVALAAGDIAAGAKCDVVYNGTDMIVLAAVDTAVARIDKANTWTKAQRGAVVALTDAANIALDLSLSNNFSVTLAGNRTLDNPTNIVPGQSGIIVVTQDATGGRTLAFGSYYKAVGGIANLPALSTAAGAKDHLAYYVASATEIRLDLGKNVS